MLRATIAINLFARDVRISHKTVVVKLNTIRCTLRILQISDLALHIVAINLVGKAYVR